MITKNEIYYLLGQLKKEISDEYRASDYPGDNKPGMQVTFATDGEKWNYQTGDNSFTGACYSLPYWAVIYLYRDSNRQNLAQDVLNQWNEVMP